MKFQTADKKYLETRKAISKKYGQRELWSATDYWPLYCGHVNLARYVAILDIVRSSLNVPGHIAEFGMYRGANFMFVAKLLRLFDPVGPKEILGFDSFEGLTTFVPQDRSADQKRGLYAGSYEELMDLIDLYEMGDDVTVYKGLIQDTLPPLLERRPELSFSLVFCDTDLYEPTRIILEGVHPRLSKGGMFVFDEWNNETYPGETTAVQEFLADHGDWYETVGVRDTRHPTMALRKTKF